MKPSVTCVVLNWNNWKDTNACLSALSRVDYDNLSVVVVDNGSTDGSVANIRDFYPEVPLIETKKNLGFAAGNNAGIRYALHEQADYIWLLNNDAEPSEKALAKLVEKAQSDPKLGAVGSVLIYAHDQEVIQAWGGGRINRWLGRTSHAICPQMDAWFDYISAASILISRKALEDVGSLDEGFFLYWEDTDFSFRLRKRGWKLGVAAGSIVAHKEGASTRGSREAFDRYATASSIRFMLKYSPFPWLSIPLSLALKAGNSLLTFRFRRVVHLAAGVRDFVLRGANRSLKRKNPCSGSANKTNDFVVNASRIGSTGGLRTFALDALDCLSKRYQAIEAVLPRGTTVTNRVKAHELPEWLGSSSYVSRLRPLFWLLYVLFFFPAKRSNFILSTTHHALPFRNHQIVTVHDLRPYFIPDTWVQKAYFRFLLPRALRRCDGILTVSNASKQAMVSVYDIPREKIHVVPNAISPKTLNGDPRGSRARQPTYLLMVGASWPHKNAVEVLQRHELWKSNYQLKILGGAGQYHKSLLRLASDLGIRDQVKFINHSTDAELDMLYRGCAALVYPSRMEGFGLPPLEAMSYGKTVIVSDIPVFRELFGNVPLYVQLGDASSWAKAFRQLSEIESSGDEERLSAGLALAASFSKERMSIALEKAVAEIWNLSPSVDTSL